MFFWIILIPRSDNPQKPKADPDKIAQIEKELGMSSSGIKLEYVRELLPHGPYQQRCKLYRYGSEYFVLSTALIPELKMAGLAGPWETMAFRADASGMQSLDDVVSVRGSDLYMCEGEGLVALEEFCQRGIDSGGTTL